MKSFSSNTCSGQIDISESANIVKIKGIIKDYVKNGEIAFIAAAPYDARASYSGSGLPFANPIQAFDNTPNQGTIKLDGNNSFEIQMIIPNSYYAGLGTVVIPPTLYVKYINKNSQEVTVNIKLSDGIPYRMLTYPMQYTAARKDCTFYSSHLNLPVRTQEQILRDSAYPVNNKMHQNFWGLRPPL